MSLEGRSDRPGTRTGTAIVLAVAAVAHLSFGELVPASVWPDSHRYAGLALDLPRRLATADWDLWTTPVYPGFLWLVRHGSARVADLVLLQQIIACGTAVMVYWTARMLVGPRGALVGGLLVALSPIRHYYAQSVLTECLSEAFLAAGIAAAARSSISVGDVALAWRAFAGVAMGLATLTRPNLAAALAVVVVLPARDARKSWLRGTALAAAVTAVAAACVLVPWLRFNANRGVEGLTGNVGYIVNAFANELGVGETIDADAFRAGASYAPADDRRLLRSTMDRLSSRPRAVAAAVGRSLQSLAVPAKPTGDVGPNVVDCAYLSNEPLPGWVDSTGRDVAGWRCRVHRALLGPISICITLGWLGLLGFTLVSLRSGRFDRVGILLIPIACLVSLALLLQANTRYAAPFEPLALGIGTAAIVELGARARSRFARGMRPDGSEPFGERTDAAVVSNPAHRAGWIAAVVLVGLVLGIGWVSRRAPAPGERPSASERAIADVPKRFRLKDGRRRPWCPLEQPARKQMSMLGGSRAATDGARRAAGQAR